MQIYEKVGYFVVHRVKKTGLLLITLYFYKFAVILTICALQASPVAVWCARRRVRQSGGVETEMRKIL
jgi:hypothetical protein